MSSAEAVVDETVVVASRTDRSWGARAAAVLGVIALTQLTWLGGIVYGAIRLLM